MDTRKQVKGETKEYAYLAFISHNSKDAHIAKRLKRSLSSYRLSSTVRKQKGLAKKLPDIFRFQDDLTVDETLAGTVRQVGEIQIPHRCLHSSFRKKRMVRHRNRVLPHPREKR